jgi:hypothetical protein
VVETDDVGSDFPHGLSNLFILTLNPRLPVPNMAPPHRSDASVVIIECFPTIRSACPTTTPARLPKREGLASGQGYDLL